MAKMLYSVNISLAQLGAEGENLKDKAMRELARYHAALLDAAAATDSPQLMEAVAKTSSPQLFKALNALGLSPESRGELGKKEDVKVANPFDELKAKRKQKTATG